MPGTRCSCTGRRRSALIRGAGLSSGEREVHWAPLRKTRRLEVLGPLASSPGSPARSLKVCASHETARNGTGGADPAYRPRRAAVARCTAIRVAPWSHSHATAWVRDDSAGPRPMAKAGIGCLNFPVSGTEPRTSVVMDA